MANDWEAVWNKLGGGVRRVGGREKNRRMKGGAGCEADAQGRHRYRDVSRREEGGALIVIEQYHECRMARETAYGSGEAVVRRRHYDPGRWLEADG